MKRCACLFLALLAAPGAHAADWKLAERLCAATVYSWISPPSQM